LTRLTTSLLILASILRAGIPLYRIDTFAGSDFNGDGRLATSAVLVQAQSLALAHTGDLYISDSLDHRVRKVSRAGTITTVAGTGASGYSGDGKQAVQARLNSPYGVAIDTTGNLYIADLGNGVVRRVSPDGFISTIAGGGEHTPPNLGAVKATEVKLIQPRDVAVDRFGTLYISDFGAHRIYVVTRDGLLLSLAGLGHAGEPPEGAASSAAALSYPAGIAVDPAGIIYIADSGNHRVRKIVAGRIFTVLDKDNKQVEFGTPTAIAVDAGGRLFVLDGGSRTTVVTPAGDLLTLPMTGSGVAATIDIYTAGGRVVRRWNGSTTDLVAGTLNSQAAGDGRPSNEWRFNSPSGVLRDYAGYVYIADTANGRVRRISPAGELTTLTTQIEAPVALAFDSKWQLYIADKASGGIYRYAAYNKSELYAKGSDNRPWKPAAMIFDSQDRLFIADKGNDAIRRVLPDGTSTVIAGGGRDAADTSGLLARISGPAGLAFDAEGNLWFSESGTSRIRKLTPAGRIVSLTGVETKEPGAIRFDEKGNLLVADIAAHRILRIAPDGSWMHIAGTGDRGFAGDGESALGAMVDRPSDLAIEPGGSLLIADAGNNRIRRLTQAGEVAEPGTVEPPAVTAPPIKTVHAATLAEQAFAPGQLVYVTSTEVAFSNATTVTVEGARAEILAVSPERLTVLLPSTLKPAFAELATFDGNKNTGKTAIEIAASAPGILTARGGAGQALATNQDASLNSWEKPAPRGSIVTFYVTGDGNSAGPVTARIGGFACDVVWAGPAPDLRGLMQINVRTPAGYAPSGVQNVVLTINGAQTQDGVTIVTR
jgi:uncharacterized protein (TIGR03437 family)